MTSTIFYDMELPQQVNRIWRLLRQTRDTFLKKVQGALAEWDLSVAEIGVLSVLHHRPQPVVVTDIARLLMEKPQTMVGMLDRMESKGLVQRFRDQQDRRLVRVEATEKGKRLYESASPTVDNDIERLLSVLNAGELNQLEGMLEKLRSSGLEALGIEYRRVETE